jgi:hypothetical protein
MPRARVRQTLALLLLALASAGCIRIGRRGVSASVPIPSSVLLESRTLDHAVRDRPGLLTPEQLEIIAPSIRALRADPVELSLLAGDTVRVADHVRILALDSAGAVLGEIAVYDFGYAGRGFRLLADGRVHLRREGTVRFTARLPARHWSGRESARPSVQVALVVF